MVNRITEEDLYARRQSATRRVARETGRADLHRQADAVHDPDAGRDLSCRSCSSSCRRATSSPVLAAQMSQAGDTIDAADAGEAARCSTASTSRSTSSTGCGSSNCSPRRFRPLVRLAACRSSDLLWNRLGLTFVLAFSAHRGHLGRRVSGRHLLGGAQVFARRLHRHLPRLPRAGDPELPARARADVSRRCAFSGMSVGGLFSPEFVDAPWSTARVVWISRSTWSSRSSCFGGAASPRWCASCAPTCWTSSQALCRVTARAKGLPEWRLILKYPVRAALNPFISTIGWTLPSWCPARR